MNCMSLNCCLKLYFSKTTFFFILPLASLILHIAFLTDSSIRFGKFTEIFLHMEEYLPAKPLLNTNVSTRSIRLNVEGARFASYFRNWRYYSCACAQKRKQRHGCSLRKLDNAMTESEQQLRFFFNAKQSTLRS